MMRGTGCSSSFSRPARGVLEPEGMIEAPIAVGRPRYGHLEIAQASEIRHQLRRETCRAAKGQSARHSLDRKAFNANSTSNGGQISFSFYSGNLAANQTGSLETWR